MGERERERERESEEERVWRNLLPRRGRDEAGARTARNRRGGQKTKKTKQNTKRHTVDACWQHEEEKLFNFFLFIFLITAWKQ